LKQPPSSPLFYTTTDGNASQEDRACVNQMLLHPIVNYNALNQVPALSQSRCGLAVSALRAMHNNRDAWGTQRQQVRVAAGASYSGPAEL